MPVGTFAAGTGDGIFQTAGGAGGDKLDRHIIVRRTGWKNDPAFAADERISMMHRDPLSREIQQDRDLFSAGETEDDVLQVVEIVVGLVVAVETGCGAEYGVRNAEKFLGDIDQVETE